MNVVESGRISKNLNRKGLENFKRLQNIQQGSKNIEQVLKKKVSDGFKIFKKILESAIRFQKLL
jgi:hypothetical protein